MEGNKTIIRSIYRGVLVSVFFIMIYAVIPYIMFLFSSMIPLDDDLRIMVVCIISAIFAPIIYNSVALAFAYSDNDHIIDYMQRDDKRITFIGEVKNIFKTPFKYGFIASVSIVLLASLIGVFVPFKYMFPEEMQIGTWFAALVLTPISSLLYIFSKYEATRYFKKLDKGKRLDEFNTMRFLIKRLILLTIMYLFLSPLAPIAALVLYSFFNVMVMMSEIMTVIGFIAAIVLLIVMIWAVKLLRGVLARKKMIKRIEVLKKLEGCEISDLKNPYRSFITSSDQLSFALTIDGERFDCIAISTISRGVPIVFTSPTDAYFLHRIGTEKHNFSLRHKIEFMHSSGGKKIIIVNPTPKSVFVEERDEKRRISVADKIWGIALYDIDSFIGCAERRCL